VDLKIELDDKTSRRLQRLLELDEYLDVSALVNDLYEKRLKEGLVKLAKKGGEEMDNKKITMNKKYRYRNGEPARILCVDAPGKRPIVSVDKNGATVSHEIDGKTSPGIQTLWDLIEVKEEKTLVAWVNIYPDGNTGNIYNTKEDAEEFSGDNRIACKKVVIKYCVGDEE
jgi:hypothetical protein